MDEQKLIQLLAAQRPTPGPAYDAFVTRRALQVAGKTPEMKKKASALMIAVALLVTLTLFGAVAELLGLNLFELFGKQDQRLKQLAPKAELNQAAPILVESPALGQSLAQINSAYYDGDSLIVTYALTNASRAEAFTPSEKELSSMQKDSQPTVMVVEDPETQDLVRQWNQAVRQGTPMGMVMYQVGVSDHTLTEDGFDLPPSQSTHKDGEGKAQYTVLEYASPLPEGVRGREVLHLHMGLRNTTTWRYFDGKDSYVRFEQEELPPMKATVWRQDAQVSSFSGSGTFQGQELTVRVKASAAYAQAELILKEGVFPELPEDAWYAVYLRDEHQRELRPQNGGQEGQNTMTIDFDGTGNPPKHLELQLRVDAEEGVTLNKEWKEPMFLVLTSTE